MRERGEKVRAQQSLLPTSAACVFVKEEGCQYSVWLVFLSPAKDEYNFNFTVNIGLGGLPVHTENRSLFSS